MKPFDAHAFVGIAQLFERAATQFASHGAFPLAGDRSEIAETFRNWGRLCAEAQLPVTKATVDKIVELASRDDATYDKLRVLIVELQGRLIDEMQQRFFLSLSMEETERYHSPRKGWEDIIARFPDVSGDIIEMWKCFALARYSAAVFHSVQVVERGLIELGPFIGVNDPLSGWTAVSNALTQLLKKNYKDLTAFEQINRPFLEQLQATVEALKNAWRNKISHAHGRLVLMTADFSAEVCEEILMATRGFMRRLAGGLPSSPAASDASPSTA